MNSRRMAFFGLLAAAAVTAGCVQTARETALLPETRDGVFYTHFAEAQALAQAEGKLIMLELWRPG